MNKGIIVAFSLLVGCGAATAAYLLYTSKRDSSDNKDSNENTVSNQNKNAITKIEQIFDKHEKNEDNTEMKETIINALNEGNKTPEEAINEANKFFEKDEEQDKAKGRSYSSDSDFSFASNETIDGGRKTKRVIKRSKKSRSKKSKSKSRSKIYKKLI